MMPTLSRLREALAAGRPLALGALVLAAGCERILVDPAPAPEGIALSLSVPEGAATQLAPGLDGADRVRIQVQGGDGVLLDTTFVFRPGTGEILVPVAFAAAERSALLRVELGQGFLPLLRGATEVQMRQRRVTDAQVTLSPVPSTPLGPATQVSAGIYHSCASTEAGTVYCWGLNETGQLGDNTLGSTPLPTQARGAVPAFRSVGASYVSSCALAADGRVFCWGSNENGALGTGGATGGSPVPTAIGGSLRFASLSVGGLHACALTAAGVAYCWGFNRFGQLGNGTTTDAAGPVAVPGAPAFRSLSAGYLHTCAVTFDDQLYCWGLNEFGQVGAGGPGDHPRPLRVGNLPAVRQVSAGGLHTCAVGTAGQLHCWGFNRFGQLGTNSTTDQVAPVPVAGVQLQQVSAGGVHTCGVATDGRALCWGYNRSGAVGDGTRVDRPAPTAVAGAGSVRMVTAGLHHSCGIAADGQVVCWGYNRFGQVGDGSTETRIRAASVLRAETFFAGSRSPSGVLREAVDLLLAGVVRP
jgi:alpha-tubulin suppressor-like RCC1 family protein